MKLIYPSKSFARNAAKVLHAHDLLAITVENGWRARLLVKEAKSWCPSASAMENSGGQIKGPSVICNLLMVSLIAIHYMALSAKYEMSVSVQGDVIVLTYAPIRG